MAAAGDSVAVGSIVYIIASPMGGGADQVFQARITVGPNQYGTYEMHALNPDGSVAGTAARRRNKIYLTREEAQNALAQVGGRRKVRKSRKHRKSRKSRRN